VVHPDNVMPVSQIVKPFLCPSDRERAVEPGWGPTNYVACWGSGAGGGKKKDADGVFYVNSQTRFADITDGTSNTAMFSEHTLGPGGPRARLTPKSARDVWVWADGRWISDASCARATRAYMDRGAKWADGMISMSGYNHWYPPNAQTPDCQARSSAWKAARSRHPGGVSLLLCDGSVRFVSDTVDLQIWRSLGSRNGGEVLGQF